MWHLGGHTQSAAGSVAQARGTTPTFNREVAPILFTHCVGCHRPDGAGPMSLLTFDGARAYATRIRQKVTANEMPPWYVNQRLLVEGKEIASAAGGERRIPPIPPRVENGR